MKRPVSITLLTLVLVAVGSSPTQPHAQPTARAVAPIALVLPAPPSPVGASREPSPATRAGHAPVNPDRRNPTGKLIEVDITEQRLRAWKDGRVVMTLTISTGMPGYETPAGRYRIRWKTRMGWSRPWQVWMPWAMQWNGNYMIHELARKTRNGPSIGRSSLGSPASHGCVRVDRGDAERLFRWTPVGTPVWVHGAFRA